MRLLLYDPAAGGHHPVMLREVAGALGSEHEVVVAARPELLAQAGELPHETLRLGPEVEEGAAADLAGFDGATARVRPDHRLHLYAIRPVLARWARRPPQPVPTSALVISPAALHYPRAYDTPLGPAEWANAAAKEVLVRRFRRRVDTHAVLTMDPEAAARWRRAAGGPVQALPEPPVRPLPGSRARRDGVVLYGALAPRKGIGLVARALGPAGGGADGLRVVLAGRVAAGYEDAFAAQALELELGGARVERHLGWLPDGVGLELLSCARCVVIAYVGHKGSSRVLTEAAAVGTPVVAHAGGLVGALVREHGLGLAVDARDPGALRAAVLALARDPEAVARHAPALAAFAEGSSPPRFRAAATAPFRGCPQARFRAS